MEMLKPEFYEEVTNQEMWIKAMKEDIKVMKLFISNFTI